MTPSRLPDCDAFLLLNNTETASLAGVYGGHDVRIKYAGITKSLSAWMMIYAGSLNETVGVSFLFDSANATLPMGEVLTLSQIKETMRAVDSDKLFEKKKVSITLEKRNKVNI